jgi:hypothetical protein
MAYILVFSIQTFLYLNLPLMQIVEFTSDERYVLAFFLLEHSNESIAEGMGVPVTRVAEIIESLRVKTGSKNEAGIVIYAYKAGLFQIYDEHIATSPATRRAKL